MPRTGRLACLALASVLLGACGAQSAADQIRATLGGYAHAVASRDYQAICDTYLSRKLADGVERNAGLPCESAIRPEISATEKPALTVDSVEVHGNRATARVHTTAANQPPSDDNIALEKIGGSWRIAALATTGPQPTGS